MEKHERLRDQSQLWLLFQSFNNTTIPNMTTIWEKIQYEYDFFMNEMWIYEILQKNYFLVYFPNYSLAIEVSTDKIKYFLIGVFFYGPDM